MITINGRGPFGGLSAVPDKFYTSVSGPRATIRDKATLRSLRVGTDIDCAALTLLAHALANVCGSFFSERHRPTLFSCWRFRNRTPGPPPFSSMTGMDGHWVRSAKRYPGSRRSCRAAIFTLYHYARPPTQNASNRFLLFSWRAIDHIAVESDPGFC